MTDTRIYRNADALARAVADRFVAVARQAAEDGRAAYFALSGGHTPKRFFKVLAEPGVRDTVPWHSVRLYWVDERDASPDHPHSNYGVARDLLLKHVPLPESHVFPMRPWDYGVAAAADKYEALLKETVPPGDDGLPMFDLVLLGVGQDGHVASLFPRTAGLSNAERLSIGNVGPGGRLRVTLTYPVLNAAKTVAMVVSGESKADVVQRVLRGPRDAWNYPAQGVAPTHGDLLWMLDQDAATRL